MGVVIEICVNSWGVQPIRPLNASTSGRHSHAARQGFAPARYPYRYSAVQNHIVFFIKSRP